MSRRYVSQLAHQESVDQIFLASEKQLRPNRNGNLYLQVELSDRSGSIGARMWNASEQDYRGFDNGDYVRVEGTTQLFQGTIQLIATSIRKAPTGEVDPDDFLILGSKEIDELVGRLSAMLRKIRDPHLLNLAECFLMDDEFMRKFSRGPGRHQEPPRLSRRADRAHRQPDGADRPRRPALSARSTPTCC